MLEVIIKNCESGEIQAAFECSLIVFGANGLNGDETMKMFNIVGKGSLPEIELLHHARSMGITIAKMSGKDKELSYVTALGCIDAIVQGIKDEDVESHIFQNVIEEVQES